MTIRTFWNLFLKVIGFFILPDFLTTIIKLVYSVIQFFIFNHDEFDMQKTLAGTESLAALITAVIYYLILRVLFFNNDWLIDKLGLDKGIAEDKIELNVSYLRIIEIVAIIVGGFILIESIPLFFKALLTTIRNPALLRDSPGTNACILQFVKGLIGFYLITNSGLIAGYFEKKMNKAKEIQE